MLAISCGFGTKAIMRRRAIERGQGEIGDAVAIEIGGRAHVERARAGNVVGRVGQLGDLLQPAVIEIPKLERADGMRLAHQRDIESCRRR